MLDMGVIRSVKPERGQIISNIFLREKKEKGQYRPILNLKPLNQFVPYKKFKVEALRNAQELLQPGGWCNLHNAGCIMHVAGHALWPRAAWLYQEAVTHKKANISVSGGLQIVGM